MGEIINKYNSINLERMKAKIKCLYPFSEKSNEKSIKKYEFVDISPRQKKINYSLAIVGSLGLLVGITGSVALCDCVVLLGGAIAYKRLTNKELSFNRLIKNKLYNLIKLNKLYIELGEDILYVPTIYYDFDEKTLDIGIKLDGSLLREKYLDLEATLEDLFLMECVSKEQGNGFILYKLDKTSTERLNINSIKSLENDLIPLNNKISWNFRKCPHGLVCGVTGKGKTYFLAYLIKMFVLLKADIKIIDPKMSDLSFLERIFKENVASSPNDIARLLRETCEKMNERYIQFKNLINYGFGKDYKDYGYKPIVIIFDEIAAFMASVDKKVAKEINDYMSEIIMKGRQAGVFMILATQRPDADTIKTAIRDQLGLRIALGEMSKTGYSMVFGSEFNSLELNSSAPGDGFIMIDGTHNKPVRFQSPYFSQDYNFVKDIAKIVRRG